MAEALNSLLLTLGLRRRSTWNPPTLLDHLLSSPLTLLTSQTHHFLVRLRGAPYSVRPSMRPITVVCISDTHERIIGPLPDGDILIHAGDMASSGSRAAIQKQLDWLKEQPHRYKIVVCGNHDSFFDENARLDEDQGQQELDLSGLVYLQREAATLDVEGRKVVVFGAPDVPFLGGKNNAFQYHEQDAPWAGLVPPETDILVTHTPPKSHMDLSLGCPSLLQELWRVRPRLHVFGHVHWGAGRESVFFDEAQRSYETLMAQARRGLVWDFVPNAQWLLMAKTLVYGVNGVLFRWLMLGPGGATGAVLVNAAQMYGNTGRMENKPQVVVI
ncbi:hypothetical protein TD95_002487 [Thielaviopsis punctulata]|uniref:Calcineurin-like phosphoesterase domain-containing protein n=1 Tax=Thielaviopsis punctulata TaxID=72032 RepID=A0A0F4ZEJ1_9PEZI|nr:hypothetical protein TD95_002487 [Thielaviopsis punctulata]